MSPTWSSSKKEREHLTKRIEEENKTSISLLNKKQKLESALWLIKSLVESAISHPETAYAVVGKVADRIEELEKNSELNDPRKKYKNADK